MVSKERMQALSSAELLAVNVGLLSAMGGGYTLMAKHLQHYQEFETPLDLTKYREVAENVIGLMQSAVSAIRELETRKLAEQPPPGKENKKDGATQG